MRRAIALSALGLGSTSPNPAVGCVILDVGGRIVGEGYHVRKGEPHAEANALRAAGGRARGGTAVVTLEPCNHVGRTPPCHQALLDAGIVRVVVALVDPTSRGAGGIALLRAGGVEVDVGVLADEAVLVLGPWLEGLRSRRPWVTWTYQLGLDGAAAPANVADAASVLHGLDAVLSEVGVVEAVLGSHGPKVFTVPDVDVGAGPGEVLTLLYEGGVRHLLIDADVDVASPFLDAGCVDEVRVWFASERSATPDPAGVDWPLVPPGFELRQVRRFDGFALIEAVRLDEPVVE